MRRLFLLFLLAAAPAAAEIRSAEDCAAAVAADPDAAREDAALWQRTGGGVPARLCEASALAALGAHTTAARLLTNLAESPNRAMAADLRAIVFTDAARQWLEAGQADLAAAALDRADRLATPGPDRQVLRARIAAADGDWPTARSALETALAAAPDDALAHALLAATLRNQGDPAAALAEAETARRLAPDLPQALFETGAALAETGETAAATKVWLQLIAADPDSELAALARSNLQRLN
jgi:tetratricopeptide (TPR) repeat protein